ncbi:MAG: alpha/beta fold hydrolase [Dehalococcoidia bacterium]
MLTATVRPLVLVLSVMALTACQGVPGLGRATATPAAPRPAEAARPPATTSPSPSPSPTPTPTRALPRPVGYEPRFEAGACPFTPAGDQIAGSTLVCGMVHVPEDRSHPDGRTVQLAVAVFKAVGGTAGEAPLLWLNGGPGGATLSTVGPRLATYGLATRPLLLERDLVLIDQRGAGASRPSLQCRELTDRKYATLGARLTPAEDRAGYARAALQCRDRLATEGVRLDAYTSAVAAADVNDIRIALGYDQVNLYGVSYGTRLALTVMRDYPAIVRGAVLDSAFPIQANLYVDVYDGAQRAFDRLFAACATEARCSAQYPDLGGAFARTVAALNQRPERVFLKNPYDGKEYETIITGDRFAEAVFLMLYQRDFLPALPRLIAATSQRRLALFSRLAAPVLFYDEVSLGLYYSVQCGEEVGFVTAAQVATARAAVRPELSAALGGGAEDALFDNCGRWGVTPPAAQENEPVTSAIPTLILAGEFDPVTPPSYAHAIAAGLSRATVVEFPGMSHGLLLADACPRTVALGFLRRPDKRPDAACARALPAPPWLTDGR